MPVMSRFSYPKVPGDTPWSIADISGPVLYAPIAPGVPPSGGQVVTAADFGLESLDWVGSMGSNNGQYNAVVIPSAFNSGAPLASVRLIWTLAATGAQAGAINLSAFTVRLFAIGR